MPAVRRQWLAVGAFIVFLARSVVARADSTTKPESLAQARAPEPATARPVAIEEEKREAVRPRPRRQTVKRFVVARDFGVAFPVGPLAADAATMYGPIVRVAYHPNERVEIGGRVGYQRGFEKEVDGVLGSLSSIPVYATTRWFPLGDRSGPYGGLDVGVNVFLRKSGPRSSFFDVGADSTWARPSANVGLGWVWSRSVPIDLRVQLAALDLIAPSGPDGALAIGVIGGYSIFF